METQSEPVLQLVEGDARVEELELARGRIMETEHRFEMMADCSPVMLWMSREDGMCTFFNKTWLQFTGRSQAEEWGIGWAENVFFEDLSACLDTYAQAFCAREEFEMEYRLQRADGEFRWVLDRGVPRYTSDKRFVGYIGSCVDISERKMRERELKDALLARNDLVRLFSHELRTPMTILSLQVDRLKSHYQDSQVTQTLQQQGDFAELSTTTERIINLINSVLYYVKLRCGEVGMVSKAFCLETIAREALDEVRLLAAQKGLQLGIVVAAPLPALCSDCSLVRIILLNLLDNAIKFTERGTIAVELGADERGQQYIMVCDTGTGISRKNISGVFAPFAQIEPFSYKHTAGFGLGLAVVETITTILGGTVTLRSTVGAGSAFTVLLPQLPLT